MSGRLFLWLGMEFFMKIVLLGGDLNAYSVAVSFHKAYGVKSTVFCRYRCGITAYSSLVEVHIEPNLTDDKIGTSVLLNFARGCKERPYLIPCGDPYVAFAVRNRDQFSSAFRFLLPPTEVYASVCTKAGFYECLQKENLPYPKTIFLHKEALSLSSFLGLQSYPAVLKPSDSVEYYAHPFEGMRKVYFPRTPREALEIAEKIYAFGYRSQLILQERIGNAEDKPKSKTLTLFADGEGRVRRGVLGEVLVEENAPSAVGNYAAILTRPPDALTCRLVSLLERIGYRGIANFDILCYQEKSFILELNPRQGRSCDYLRAAGVNLASFLVDAIGNARQVTDLTSRIAVWSAVPLRAVMRRVSEENRRFLRSLKARGRVYSPFKYEGEEFSMRRMLYMPIHALRRTRALNEGVKNADE